MQDIRHEDQGTMESAQQEDTVAAPGPIRTVAVLGSDYPGVTFDLRVAKDDPVLAGQTLCVDRRRPDICIVSPVAGRVSRVGLGVRRSLATLEIAVGGDGAHGFDVDAARDDDAALRRLLLASGEWAGFRTRPFGFVPDPEAVPAAIFVNATDPVPGSAETDGTKASDRLARGIGVLLRLTAGKVFVAQQSGPPVVPAGDRLWVVAVAGTHPAGQAGLQIHRLCPASRTRQVWQIGVQDVVAIGHLLDTGRIAGSRIVTLSGGPAPVLVRAPLGARLADLAEGLCRGEDPSLVSGPLHGTTDPGQTTGYLRRHDLLVRVRDRPARSGAPRPVWHRLLDMVPAAETGAIIPLEAFERAFGFDLLPVPLMRALAVGDVETAERLGCLELLEEDMAPLSRLCPSRSDYGALLRRTLNSLAEEMPR